MARKLPTIAAYDDQAIWGVGHTELDAVNDALEWQTRDDNGDGLKTAEMTPALAEKVDASGGSVGFYPLKDGRLGTEAEWNAE
jgi:hypothetical protein